MRHIFFSLGLLSLIALTGCSTSPSIALYEAVKDNNYPSAKRAIEKSSGKLNMCNLVDDAVSQCKPNVLERALREGASANCRGRIGFSALYSSIALRCSEAALLLISRGADVNDSGPAAQGQTPLDTAHVTKNTAVVAALEVRGGRRRISEAEVAQIQRNARDAQAASEREQAAEEAAQRAARGAVQPALPPAMTAQNPACATGQRELVSAQRACANGESSQCARAPQLSNALRTLNCAVPVLGAQPEPADLSTQAPKTEKQTVNCVRAQRTQSGAIELYNGCAFTINYAFCVQGTAPAGSGSASSSFACAPSLDSRGMDFLGPGKTSFGYRGSNVIFAACEGGASGGNYAQLKGGRASCRS